VSGRGHRLVAVLDREFRTALRTRALLALSVGFLLVVVGLTATGGATGYVPTTLNLLTPVEVLVPTLAFAFAYRAVLDDRESGELGMLRTYPLDRPTYVLGVFLGRAAALLSVVVGSLVVAGAMTATRGGPSNPVVATHAAGDSPLLYARFLVLSALFALVALAAAVAVSALAGSVRAALAMALGLVVVLVVGLDLGILAGLTGGVVGDGLLAWVVPLSPNSAYRGLVMGLVVGPVATPASTALAPVLNALGLLAWLFGSLAAGIAGVWRPAR
jgi:ABC-2 type transport system permease protein